MIKTADLPENAIKHMRVAVMLALVAILLLITGCISIFDSENAALTELENHAIANKKFFRPNVKIVYVFAESPKAYCRNAGLSVSRGDALACAILGDPCVVVLPYAPTKLMVREEQLHCVYGDWHVST